MFPRKTAAMEIPPAYACFSRPIRSAAIRTLRLRHTPAAGPVFEGTRKEFPENAP